MPAPRDARSDQQLVDAANHGDASAFEALYDRYRDWVFNLALRFTRDHALAADVTQETFLYLLRKFPGLTLTAKLTTFLYPVVRHNALAAQRSVRRMQHAEHMDTQAPAGDVHESALRQAVDALEPGQREVIILRFVDELSLQEIALALQIPLGTVKSRLHGALSRLRASPQLRKYFDSP